MLAKKRNELIDAKKVHDGKRTECVKAEKNLDQYCKTRSQFIKSMLEGTGEGNNYGNYNKTKYRVLADELLGKGDMATHLLDDESEKELLGMHRATPKPEIPEPVYPTLDLVALQEKVADQLSRTVTSKAIGSLRDDPGRAEWVRRGMDLYDAKVRACPFCEQQVPDHRELELRHHFSSEHEDMMRALDELAAEIDGIRESCLSKLVTPDCEMIHDHLLDKYEKARIALGDYRSQVKKYLDSLADAISAREGGHSIRFRWTWHLRHLTAAPQTFWLGLYASTTTYAGILQAKRPMHAKGSNLAMPPRILRSSSS